MTRALEVGGGTTAPEEWDALQSAVAAAVRVGVPVPCRADPDAWFRHSQGAQAVAAQRCAPCLALFECRAYAQKAGEDQGVWGGLTEADRAAERRPVGGAA